MKTKCYWLLVNEINLVDIQSVLEYDTLEIVGDFAHCFFFWTVLFQAFYTPLTEVRDGQVL